MAKWHVAPLRFAPAFRALAVCEHSWLRYDNKLYNINCTKCRVSFLYKISSFVFVRNVWFWFLYEMSCVRIVVPPEPTAVCLANAHAHYCGVNKLGSTSGRYALRIDSLVWQKIAVVRVEPTSKLLDWHSLILYGFLATFLHESGKANCVRNPLLVLEEFIVVCWHTIDSFFESSNFIFNRLSI